MKSSTQKSAEIQALATLFVRKLEKEGIGIKGAVVQEGRKVSKKL